MVAFTAENGRTRREHDVDEDDVETTHGKDGLVGECRRGRRMNAVVKRAVFLLVHRLV